MKARGLEVVIYPFVMMDVAAGNDLPNPYGGTGQPPYPWRGRITCHPAPGHSGSPDMTSVAGDQVAQWFDRTWGFRRLVLHYANLAEEAGGVDSFILGSELVGLTRVRSASGVYPAVGELIQLAGDMRAILGSGTAIVYAADWTEYGAHVLDSGDEVRFPLDPLFASDDIDAVGIDYYPPISDWRDGPDHADLTDARSIYDVDYLRKRLGSGEAFDWYYANASERASQTRRPITDGAHDKPWVFRANDLVSWWSNPHVERWNGAEIRTTEWQPKSKPIWLTEIGVPAVDKGPNGPNVFPDPKSSGSAYPPFSRGVRDDLIQARCLEAILSRFDPALRGFSSAYNPTSSEYGGFGVWRAHGRSGQRLCPGLGRAALSRLSRFRQCVVGRGELGDRPLDHRPHRGRCPRSPDRGDPQGFRPRRSGRASRRRFRGRLRDRPAHVGARRTGAADAPLRRRRGGERRQDRVARARRTGRDGVDEG
nr:glycoside hydrolase TIM-barrel-like domain-containing protein [Microvirga roseola]